MDIVTSLGVGTPRHIHGSLLRKRQAPDANSRAANEIDDSDAYEMDLPFGSSVVRWDFASSGTPKRVFFKQLHDDALTNLASSPTDASIVISTSYGGEFAFWRVKGTQIEGLPSSPANNEAFSSETVLRDYESISKFIAAPEGQRAHPIMYLHWRHDGKMLAIGSFTRDRSYLQKAPSRAIQELVPQNDGYITVWDVSDVQRPVLKAVHHEMFDSMVHWMDVVDGEGNKVGMLCAVANYPRKPCVPRDVTRGYLVFVVTDSAPSIQCSSELVLYGEEGTKEVARVQLHTREVAVMRVDEQTNRVFTSHNDRMVVVNQVSIGSIVPLCSVKVPGSGPMFSMLLQRDEIPSADAIYLLTPSDSGFIDTWRFAMHNGKFQMNPDSIRRIETIQGAIYHLQWEVEGESFWLASCSGLYRVSFDARPQVSLNYHDLSCCGVDIHPDSSLIAAGDLGGQIIIWSSDAHTPKHAPTALVKQEAMARSLCWVPGTDIIHTLFFGLMDGKIGAVYIKEDGSVLSSKILLSFDDVITCVRARRLGPLSEMILGASDAGGFVRIFKVTTDDAGDIVLSKLVTLEAHLQQSHVTSKEIWSIIFSPDGRFVATGGEDGTTHVYRMIWNEDASKLDLKLLEILEDKFAAVTCLDWKETPQGNVLMVTSDDRTVHFWRLNDDQSRFEVVKKVETAWEHLMITYGCLESGGSRAVCGTMSGHFYVIDIDQTQQRPVQWVAKTHMGSIEGISWAIHSNAHVIASCSSDCTINTYTFRTSAPSSIQQQ